MDFEIKSAFKPTGDQPEAIKQIVTSINNDEKFQTLLGVTGSGKTFTMANIIREVKKPTLILAHNKTLAAQLYSVTIRTERTAFPLLSIDEAFFWHPLAFPVKAECVIANAVAVPKGLRSLKARAKIMSYHIIRPAQ